MLAISGYFLAHASMLSSEEGALTSPLTAFFICSFSSFISSVCLFRWMRKSPYRFLYVLSSADSVSSSTSVLDAFSWAASSVAGCSAFPSRRALSYASSFSMRFLFALRFDLGCTNPAFFGVSTSVSSGILFSFFMWGQHIAG